MLNKEGRRAKSSFADVGETEVMKVWDRWARFGGARGPPGTEGGVAAVAERGKFILA